MIVIGLDFGTRFIGVAVGRDEPRLSLPLFTVDTASDPDFIGRLRQLVEEEHADKVVIGLPNALSGADSDSAIKQAVHVFAQSLGASLPCPIVFMDERFTSNAAAVLRRDFPTADEHALAAMIIAEGYLTKNR